jgi:two-component system, sensor histidine kinase
MNIEMPIPDNEIKRVARLRDYEILDSKPEEAFDRITRVAAHLFDVSIALVSLVDESRQWFKSRQGLEATETPRELAFCAHAIMQDELFIIPDAALDARFKNNPLVTGGPKIRFYAGAPLRTHDGLGLGTLCVIDTKPRDPSARELSDLRDLADLAMDALNLRRAGRLALDEAHQTVSLDTLQSSFIDSINHELRTPLTSIAGSLNLLASGALGDLEQETQNFIAIAERNTSTLMELIVDLLDMSQLEKGEMEFEFASFDLVDLAKETLKDANPDGDQNRITMGHVDAPQMIYADRKLIKKAMSVLIDNAVRFSPADSPITVHLNPSLDSLVVEVCDLGIGIPLRDRPRVFKKFVKLAESSNVRGTGLGLSIAKKIVEAHGGEIGIRANAPQGSCVFFEIPRTLLTEDQKKMTPA